MNTNLLTIVKQIIADYGEAILEDPQRLKALFGDLAKDEPKPLRIAFGRCIEAGAYAALKTAPDTAERALRKTEIAQRVNDEQGLDIRFCAEALDILEAAIIITPQPTSPVCKTCGKELQADWKACPYCGKAVSQNSGRVEMPEEIIAPEAPQTTVTPNNMLPSSDSESPGLSFTQRIGIGIVIGFLVILFVYACYNDMFY